MKILNMNFWEYDYQNWTVTECVLMNAIGYLRDIVELKDELADALIDIGFTIDEIKSLAKYQGWFNEISEEWLENNK